MLRNTQEQGNKTVRHGPVNLAKPIKFTSTALKPIAGDVSLRKQESSRRVGVSLPRTCVTRHKDIFSRIKSGRWLARR